MIDNILTIGYESSSLEDFIATLKQQGVNWLLDIREYPGSRRKGFSKNILKEELASHGIAYHHEKRLGSPRDIRHQLREDSNYTVYFQAFDQYIDTQMDLIENLSGQLTGTVVLLCYERDYKICHRSSVAKRFEQFVHKKPLHIGVRKDAGKVTYSKGLDFGQSLPAAECQI
jgi:uncharacterized protein (DUF488 family)